MKDIKNAIILVSGGLDSVVTAYNVKNNLGYETLKFLYMDYAQRAIKEEEYCSRKIAKLLKADFIKIKIPWLGKISTAFINKNDKIPKTTEKDLEDGRKEIINWWVPTRNSIFIINALAHSEYYFIKDKKRYDIFMGLINEGQVFMKDTTEKFIKKVNELSEEATYHGGYKIITPLIKMDKTEVIKLGKKLNVPFRYTYSCYIKNGFKKGIPLHCGECLNCMLRKKGFYWAGIKDPSLYTKK
ncbi:MAG: 7-cyano-7-deazaguanine synthase [Nanoarchaeota archaeon]